MEQEFEQIGTGAEVSDNDPRTVIFNETAFAGEPLVKGGTPYFESDIEHQHLVGICTAISRVQLRQKQTGKKYSPEFQYLLQKKYYDGAWFEGSSILNSNKVAMRFGFLLAKDWTHTTEADRYLPYNEYEAKLRSIPQSEIDRLIKLCVDPIAGYAAVDISDSQKIAKAINETDGILCRYDCGLTWWTDIKGRSSWKEKDISPLRKPKPATSGHAIISNQFDFSSGEIMHELTNTWGVTWARKGSSDIDWNEYRMTEAFVDLPEKPVIVYYPVTRKGHKGAVVKDLQKLLNLKGGFTLTVDGDFGNKTLTAVRQFQLLNGLVSDGVVGKLTWAKLKE